MGLSPFVFLAAFPALAAYDLNDVTLGASERDIRRQFPQANCRELEWKSRAADRRCDDSRVKLGGIHASVTFYLRNGAVEAFDLRFDKRDYDGVRKILDGRYGAPAATEKGDVKAEWRSAGERARITVEQGRRRASLLVWRGAFQDEIYKIR